MIKQNDFIRMQLIMQDNNASSFETNLSKIVSLILFDADTRLDLATIRKEIQSVYDLEFTEEEIKAACEKKHSGIIAEKENKTVSRHGENFSVDEVLYRLDEKTVDKYKKFTTETIEQEVITEFRNYIKEKEPEVCIDNFGDLLHRFLYNIFNSNKETLLLLLNKQTEKIEVDREDFEFNDDEKFVINAFLNWNNSLKDQLIFQTVSYCVEYCLLTVKKGYSSYQNIFAGKRFYLDSNVILRLAGINNEERKLVISSFIKKCQENGIIIVYTNHTYAEIKETIKRNVKIIKDILGGHRMVGKRYWKSFSKPSTNLDFIDLYDDWVKHTTANYSDFKAFEKYVMKTIDDILRGFEKEEYVDFGTVKKEEFGDFCDSLKRYKSSRKVSFHERTIATDVNNFMFVRNKRKISKGTSFTDIKEYLISTDSNLCNWSKSLLPGSIPTVVLPSVWYSLILKFKGRAEDDYKAFNLFLNLRYRVHDDKIDNQKEQILRIVQTLNEPVELKNLMLDEIAESLNDDVDEVEIEKIVEDAKQSVIKKEAQRLFKCTEQEVIADTTKQTEASTLLKLAENNANRKRRTIEHWLTFLDVFRIISAIMFVSLIIGVVVSTKGDFFKTMNLTYFGLRVDGWIGLVSGLVTLIVFFVIEPIKNMLNRNYTFERICDKEHKKLEKSLYGQR